MNEYVRTAKLLVVTDESGSIVSALWPGVSSEGAPTETGVSLEEGQSAHEVDVPPELFESTRPDIGRYRLQLETGGQAVLYDKHDS